MLNFTEAVTIKREGFIVVLPITKFDEYHILYASDINTIALSSYSYHDLSKPCIFVGPDFMRTDEKIQRFLLQHEIGHILNGHVNLPENAESLTIAETTESLNKYLTDRINSDDVDPIELIADKYAADILGVDYVIESLQLLIKYFTSVQNDILFNPDLTSEFKQSVIDQNKSAFREINARIKMLG
jgi:hypothetical protein